MFKQIALWAIGLYQRHLSPRKGYSCAYRVHVGGTGCSGFGKHAIRKHGVLLGLVLLRRRFAKCAWHAHQTVPTPAFSATTRPRGYGPLSRQGGFVDCDCGGCDVPSCDIPTPSCDAMACEMPDCGAAGGLGNWIGCLDLCQPPCVASQRQNRSCPEIDGCGSGSGVQREDARLERARKRREDSDSTADFDSDSGDGGGGD